MLMWQRTKHRHFHVLLFLNVKTFFPSLCLCNITARQLIFKVLTSLRSAVLEQAEKQAHQLPTFTCARCLRQDALPPLGGASDAFEEP